MCFGDYQFFFGISDVIGSLLEHLPLSKGYAFGIGERDGSLLEMLVLGS